MLDEAGYLDTDGDGVREMPDGGRDLTFRYGQRSESENEPALGEFITGWLEDIGIATTVEVYDDSELTEVIGAGNYDLFVWGWTPFVDPDPLLSYFTCDQVTTDADEHRLQRRQLVLRGVRRAVRAAERRARPASGAARSSTRCC